MCVLLQCFQDNKRGGFPPWGEPGNGTWWFPCAVASSPVSLQLNISPGETPWDCCGVPSAPVSEHWTGMTFQQAAIYGTWVPSNNQICLWSRATALGHSAIFTAINFSIYKFLLGVVTVNNSQSCLMRAVFLSFAGNHGVMPHIWAQQGNHSQALFAPHSAL